MRKFNRLFFGFIFRLIGWKIEGALPDTRKYVIAVAPHTSNWDFPVGYCVKEMLDIRANFLGKKSLFTIPVIGWFLRWMGGVPVDRSKNVRLVDQIVEKFQERDTFVIAITPEGTRSRNDNWKTGFYYVAQKAEVPIIMAGMDYSRKVVEFSEPMWPKGDLEADIQRMKDFFRPMKGKYPEKGVH